MGADNQTTRREVLSACATAMTASATGCLGLGGPPINAFELRITDVRIPNAGLTSATIPFVLEATNNSDGRSIPSPTIQYDAYVNEVKLASGRETFPTLGSGETTSENLNFTASYADAGEAIADAISNRQFTLELRGEAESERESVSWSDSYQV